MYRYVPLRWRLFMQLATLLVTSLIGLSIALTPPVQDPRLTAFEHATSGVPVGMLLMACGVVGFIAELLMAKWRETKLLYTTVTSCHIVLFGAYMALSAGALLTTLRTEHWYTFGGPVLGVLLALWHLMYVQRRRIITFDPRDLSDG